MQLKVIGSSSKGNAYVLDGQQESLVIEAGIKLKEVKRAIGFDNLPKVVGCIISHSHNDHAGYATEYAAAGIKVLALQATLEAKSITRNCMAIEEGKGYKIGGFIVYPFGVMHDVPCIGYVVCHEECGKLVFFTDTYACQHSFTGVNHYLIEANYSDERLAENIAAGRLPPMLRDRLLTSHMEIGNTIAFLRRNPLNAVRNIILVHLSDGNSDEVQFIDRTVAATGKRVYAASAGMVIDINRSPL
ncbi:MBL fold metallo-hydrolase [Muribaculum intestinale]|uniref:MBL fold metallo-hydrolase n=1 Tax=Muribaculum intestinale TaxID=1796646 RepID=UPI00242B17A4|nr:MBL fold metallo-hydrolase [Muribaculum intestinale]